MKIIKNAKNWKIMAGDTVLIKKINSFLTCQYISTHDVQSDECLEHALAISRLPVNRIHIAKYLLDSFGTYMLFDGESIRVSGNVNGYWNAAGRVVRYVINNLK